MIAPPCNAPKICSDKISQGLGTRVLREIYNENLIFLL